MAFGIDFEKLRDPVWQAKYRAEREAEEARIEAHDNALRAALNTCLDHREELPANERSLISSVQYRMNSFQSVTEPQEKWLFDITNRLKGVAQEPKHVPLGLFSRLKNKPANPVM